MNLLKNYTSKNEAELAKLFDRHYDLDLNEFIFSRDDSGRILAKIVSDKSVNADAEMVISSDGLKASVNIYPAINDGKMLTANRVMELLQEENITVNIHRDAIDNAVSLCNEGGDIREYCHSRRGGRTYSW